MDARHPPVAAGGDAVASRAAKVVIVSSRFPWPAIQGDRVRALVWLEALKDAVEVTFVSPSGPVPQGYSSVRFVRVSRTFPAFVHALIGVLFRGWPVEVLHAPYDWRGALQGLTDEGDFDVAVVLLSRTDPVVFRFLHAGVRILDAVDSLSRSISERRRAASTVLGMLWKLEQGRLERLEAGVSRRYDRVIVVSPDERRDFGPEALSISNGVEILPAGERGREYDFGFWGRIAYFANRDAVELLVEKIWPGIRNARPHATLAIAGADAPMNVRRWDGSDGVRVLSPVEDRATHLRSVRVMLFPIRFGTGQLNKILESAEAGCAIVATSMALRGLDELRSCVVVEDDLARFGERAAELLADDCRRRDLGTKARDTVSAKYPRSATLAALRRLVTEAIG